MTESTNAGGRPSNPDMDQEMGRSPTYAERELLERITRMDELNKELKFLLESAEKIIGGDDD